VAHEQDLAEQWLYEQLHGDAALLTAAPGGVHAEIPPTGTVYPFVVFQLQGATDLMYNSGRRVWADTLWLVTVTDRVGDDSAFMAAALDRIDEDLHLASGDVGDAHVVSCHREGMFSQPTVESGVHYRRRGGFWRIRIKQPATV
jgi:hypothetical protein